MAVLVTGGAGYIGSHICVALMELGYDVVIADNLSNSKMESVIRIEKITGKKPGFYLADVCDKEKLENIFEKENIDSVIHLAGYKAVGESVKIPLDYYGNNIVSALSVLETMKKYNVKKFVFSSSATVYGSPSSDCIREDAPVSAVNPYGRTKLFIEEILRDYYASDNSLSIAILRYFNPIGAHPSGLIGEDPVGIPNNLFPYITQVASGRLEKLHIFGNDYPTPDGTGVRDYIHVMDLAEGHAAALKALDDPGLYTYNLGTGTGYSVLDMVNAFVKVTGINIPYTIDERRSGDVPRCCADPSLAEKEICWKAKRTLDDMCRDAWKWQSMNPTGYPD